MFGYNFAVLAGVCVEGWWCVCVGGGVHLFEHVRRFASMRDSEKQLEEMSMCV